MAVEFYFKDIIRLWEKICGGTASVVGLYEFYLQGIKRRKLKDFPAKAHGNSQGNTWDVH